MPSYNAADLASPSVRHGWATRTSLSLMSLLLQRNICRPPFLPWLSLRAQPHRLCGCFLNSSITIPLGLASPDGTSVQSGKTAHLAGCCSSPGDLASSVVKDSKVCIFSPNLTAEAKAHTPYF